MGSSGTTTARLLRLLSLLQTPRDWTGPVLAERLQVSERTVRRDVERLRDLGYRVDATRGAVGGYRLVPGAQLPPLLLDDEQVTAVAVALQAVPLAGTGVDEAAERALSTLRRVMPSRAPFHDAKGKGRRPPPPPRRPGSSGWAHRRTRDSRMRWPTRAGYT